MDRYPRRPRVPYGERRPVDYLWWAFLVVFRIWLICQLVTGGIALIYRLLSPRFQDFMFADYIALWDRYAPLFMPDWVDWMPMWYEPEAYPVIAVLLVLRLLEFMRHVGGDRPIASRAFERMSARPRRERRERAWSTGADNTYDDDAFAFNARRFHEAGQTDPAAAPLQIESFERRMRRYTEDADTEAPRDAKDEKAAHLLRDPRTPQKVREATLRLLERRRGRGAR